ncbi:amidophosphoribosyltransferase [Alphaproteobacteria bacterium]|nr:amidophosphoribosyltransferase [Alphaproteobacteria bacterium]
MNFSKKIYGLLALVKDIFFPIKCECCNEFVESIGLCTKCWKKIAWISDPKCRICGTPFELDVSEICANCAQKKPFFDRGISVFEYNDLSNGMILRFKHMDSIHLCPQFATWMYRAGEEHIKEAELIVPVPIHLRKRLKRKYNQSELLSMEISRLSGIKYEPRILRKSKHTLQQEGLKRERREQNVIGSFDVDPQYANLLENKKVVLIDDVFTTGATANECSKVLKQHGASSVTVVTLAKVVIR